ncbi:hypothetical protein JCM10213_007142 [Rhodosporidiobolus nylandii]
MADSPSVVDEEDSPILWRSPSAAHSNRLSRLVPSSSHPTTATSSTLRTATSLPRPERPPRRRPISLRDPGVEEGEGYWRGEVRRRKSVGLGLAFGLEGFEIGEEDEGEKQDEHGERQGAQESGRDALVARRPSAATAVQGLHTPPPPDSLSPAQSPPHSPVPPSLASPSRSLSKRLSTYTTATMSTTASPSRGRPSALSRHSFASGTSTAATSLSGEEDDDLPLTPGLAPPQFALAPPVGGKGKAPLTPETLHEAFDFPLPPGVALRSSSPTFLAPPGQAEFVEEPSQLDAAAASFAFASPSLTSFASLGSALGSEPHLPSYRSSTTLRVTPDAVRRPQVADPWAVDPATLDEEDQAVLGALLPMAMSAADNDDELEDEETDSRRSAATPAGPVLIPIIHRQQPSIDLNTLLSFPSGHSANPASPLAPPYRSPSLDALSRSEDKPKVREQLRSPFGFIHKSPSFTSSIGGGSSDKPPRGGLASPAPVSPRSLSPSLSASGNSSKRTSVLMSLSASFGGLGRSRSKTNGEKGLPAIGEGSSSSSGRSSGSKSVTGQLHSGALSASPSGISEEYRFAPSSSFAAFAGRSPSLFPHTPEMEQQELPTVKVRPNSKAAKMLGVDAGKEVLVVSPRPSPKPSPRPLSPAPEVFGDDEDSLLEELSGALSPGGNEDPDSTLTSSTPSFRSRSPRPPPLNLSTSSLHSSSLGGDILRVSNSKAAKMLGLSEAEVGAALPAQARSTAPPSSPSRNPRVLQKKGPEGGKSGVRGPVSPQSAEQALPEVERRMPKWPAKRDDVREFEVLLADLFKLSTSPATILRPPKLVFRPRLITFSRTFPSASSAPTFTLSSYKTRALSERETSRLTLSASSVVCAPAEGETPTRSHGGRAFAIKVTGLCDALSQDGHGRTERKTSSWIIGIDDLDEYTRWMAALKGAVRELKGEFALPPSKAAEEQQQDFALLSPTSAGPLVSPTSTSSDAIFDIDSARKLTAASLRSRTSSAASEWADRRLELSSSGWRVGGGGGSGGSGLAKSTGTPSVASRNPSLAGSTQSLRQAAPPAWDAQSAYSTPAADDYSLYSLEAASTYSGSFSGGALPSSSSTSAGANSRAHLPLPPPPPPAAVPLSASFLDADSSDEELAVTSPPPSERERQPRGSLVSPHTRTLGSLNASAGPGGGARRESNDSALRRLQEHVLPPRAPPPSSALPLPPPPPPAPSSTKRLSVLPPSSSAARENIPPPRPPPPPGALPLPPPPKHSQKEVARRPSRTLLGALPLPPPLAPPQVPGEKAVTRRPSRTLLHLGAGPVPPPSLPPPSGGLPPVPGAPPASSS